MRTATQLMMEVAQPRDVTTLSASRWQTGPGWSCCQRSQMSKKSSTTFMTLLPALHHAVLSLCHQWCAVFLFVSPPVQRSRSGGCRGTRCDPSRGDAFHIHLWSSSPAKSLHEGSHRFKHVLYVGATDRRDMNEHAPFLVSHETHLREQFF